MLESQRSLYELWKDFGMSIGAEEMVKPDKRCGATFPGKTPDVNVHVVIGKKETAVEIVKLGGRVQALFKRDRCGPQGRGRLPAQRCLARGCQRVEDMPMRRLERGDDGHHRFHNPGALWAVGPKAALAPEHAAWLVGSLPACRTNGHKVCRRLRRSRHVPAVLGTPQVWPASSRRSIARRIGRMSEAKRACASVPSRTRCHQ